MKVLHGLLKLVIFGLLIAGCVYLFLNPVSNIYEEGVALLEQTPLRDNANARQAAAVILGVILLILLLPVRIWPGRKEKNITFAGNHGEVTVDLEPVERTLETVIQRLHEVKRVHDVRLKPIGGKKEPKNKVQATVYVSLIKDANADARRITERVNSFIQSHTRRILGIQDVEVKLNVRRWVMNMKTVKPEPLLLTAPDDEDLNRIPSDFREQPAHASTSTAYRPAATSPAASTASAATAGAAAGIAGAHVEPAPRHTAAEAYEPPSEHKYQREELEIPPAGVATAVASPPSDVDELESHRISPAAAGSQADVVYGDPAPHDTAAEPDEAPASTSQANVVCGDEHVAESADLPYRSDDNSARSSVYDEIDNSSAEETSAFSRSAFTNELNEDEAEESPDARVDWSTLNDAESEEAEEPRRWQA